MFILKKIFFICLIFRENTCYELKNSQGLTFKSQLKDLLLTRNIFLNWLAINYLCTKLKEIPICAPIYLLLMGLAPYRALDTTNHNDNNNKAAAIFGDSIVVEKYIMQLYFILTQHYLCYLINMFLFLHLLSYI